jgi:hypothetical protein
VPIISIAINNSSQHFARCEAGKAVSADSSRGGEISGSSSPSAILLANGAGCGTIRWNLRVYRASSDLRGNFTSKHCLRVVFWVVIKNAPINLIEVLRLR